MLSIRSTDYNERNSLSSSSSSSTIQRDIIKGINPYQGVISIPFKNLFINFNDIIMDITVVSASGNIFVANIVNINPSTFTFKIHPVYMRPPTAYRYYEFTFTQMYNNSASIPNPGIIALSRIALYNGAIRLNVTNISSNRSATVGTSLLNLNLPISPILATEFWSTGTISCTVKLFLSEPMYLSHYDFIGPSSNFGTAPSSWSLAGALDQNGNYINIHSVTNFPFNQYQTCSINRFDIPFTRDLSSTVDIHYSACQAS